MGIRKYSNRRNDGAGVIDVAAVELKRYWQMYW